MVAFRPFNRLGEVVMTTSGFGRNFFFAFLGGPTAKGCCDAVRPLRLRVGSLSCTSSSSSMSGRGRGVYRGRALGSLGLGVSALEAGDLPCCEVRALSTVEEEERGGVSSCSTCSGEEGRSGVFPAGCAGGLDLDRAREGSRFCTLGGRDCDRPRGACSGEGERDIVKSMMSSRGGTERRGGIGVLSISQAASSSSEDSSSAGLGDFDLRRLGAGFGLGEGSSCSSSRAPSTSCSSACSRLSLGSCPPSYSPATTISSSSSSTSPYNSLRFLSASSNSLNASASSGLVSSAGGTYQVL